MNKPNYLKKAVANHALSMFGGVPTVQDYKNENCTDVIAILFSQDIIELGISSIGTIGLSEFIMVDQKDRPLNTRVELCAAAPTSELVWRNVVASSAFYIKKEDIAVAPGVVLPNIFMDYSPTSPMPHVYLTVPFLWGEGFFKQLTVGSVSVNWLQCISIYDLERAFIQEFGSEAFEELLQQQEVDIFDFGREVIRFG
jgi:hypothetical protein